jgi:glucose-6-phosphate isomerase
MTAEVAGIYLDYSKNRITDQALKLLVQLAHESGLRDGSTRRAATPTIRINWCRPCAINLAGAWKSRPAREPLEMRLS